jgi:hypothetical protein
MTLSSDAMIFGLGNLRSHKSTLRFGGDGAEMEITPRARAALDELLAGGYAEKTDPDDSIPNREHYRGTNINPPLVQVAKTSGLDPFSLEHNWTTFSEIDPSSEPQM